MEEQALSIVRWMADYTGKEADALRKQMEPQAWITLKTMTRKVLDRIRGDPRGAVIVDGFVDDPETYERPLAKEFQNRKK